MGSTVVPRLFGVCALVSATAAPLAAQSGSASVGDTLAAAPGVSIDVRLGGAGEVVDPTAPRPVRRLDAAAPLAVLPPSVLQRAPFPVDARVLGSAPTIAGDATLSGDVVSLAGRDGPAVGSRVQLWRPGVPGESGAVGWPVALGTMVSGSAIRIDRILDRVQPGDRLRAVPPDPDLAGRRLEPVTAGRRTAVVDRLPHRVLAQPGDWVRLAIGEDAGLRPGDEFVPVAGPADLHSETRLQVVSVHASQSIARILKLGSSTLLPGVTVRLDRRVR